MDAVVPRSSQRDEMAREATEVYTIRPCEALPAGKEIDAYSAFLSPLLWSREMPSRRALFRICRGSSFLMPSGRFSVKDLIGPLL